MLFQEIAVKDAERRWMDKSDKMQTIKLYNPNWTTGRDLKFRLIKLEKQDGIFMPFFNPSRKRLARLLTEYQPKNAYCSVARWAYFVKEGDKENILLDSNIVVDLDDGTLKILNKIIVTIKQAYPSLKLRYKVRSSKNHYHLIYDQKVYIPHSNKRFEYYKNMMQEITSYLELKGFEIDVEVGKNINGVLRIQNTWNGNKNDSCYSLGSSSKGTMTGVQERISPRPKAKGREGIKTTLPTPIKFISNSVVGAKGTYIPVIKWKQPKKRLLKDIVKRYGLGSFVWIKLPDWHYFVFFKCFDKDGIIKIYRKAKSASLNEFLKFEWNIIPFKGVVFLNKFIKNEGKGVLSRPHLEFFKIDVKKHNSCGSGKLKVYNAKYSLKK